MELLEAELFGYKKGSFSGAVKDHEGLFAQASGGTLFLDEIGDMPLALQAKLLRVLQEGEIRPVGGKVVQKVDVRVLAATHRDLEDMAAQGKFRADLVYRLRGYTLHLPPLRDRERDVITLARAILSSTLEFASKCLSHDTRELLMTHTWPGNVRELRNAMLAAAVDAPRCIGAHHLRPHLTGGGPMISTLPLKDRLLTELAGSGRLTLTQLQDRVRLSKPTLHRQLNHLLEQDKIHRIASGGSVCFAPSTTEAVAKTVLPNRQTQALQLAKEMGRFTRQQFADTVGISLRTASRELAAMVGMGLLTSDGRGGRMGGYVLCPV